MSPALRRDRRAYRTSAETSSSASAPLRPNSPRVHKFILILGDSTYRSSGCPMLALSKVEGSRLFCETWGIESPVGEVLHKTRSAGIR